MGGGKALIIKPLNSTEGSKKDITICNSYEELDSTLKQRKTHEHRFIVEKYIEKESEYQLIGCSLPGEIIIPGYTLIIRQPYNTNTGYLKFQSLSDNYVTEDLINRVKNMIRYIGYTGLFSVEFLRGKDGKDYFLEINMRNDGNAFCVTCAGVNLPYLWYKYADTPELPDNNCKKISKSVYWMPEADVKNIQEVGVCRWINEWVAADGHGIANGRDPLPLISYLLKRLLIKIRTVCRI